MKNTIYGLLSVMSLFAFAGSASAVDCFDDQYAKCMNQKKLCETDEAHLVCQTECRDDAENTCGYRRSDNNGASAFLQVVSSWEECRGVEKCRSRCNTLNPDSDGAFRQCVKLNCDSSIACSDEN